MVHSLTHCGAGVWYADAFFRFFFFVCFPAFRNQNQSMMSFLFFLLWSGGDAIPFVLAVSGFVSSFTVGVAVRYTYNTAVCDVMNEMFPMIV